MQGVTRGSRSGGVHAAAAIVLALGVLTAACATGEAGGQGAGIASASPQPEQPPPQQPPAQPDERAAAPPRASLIAQRLVLAEAAYEQGDAEALGRLMAALEAGGIQPHDAPAREVFALWQQAASGQVTPYRGRLLGPAYVRGELGPGEVWRSAQTFKSGEASTLAVSHKGAGPVRMKVSDGKARMVCRPVGGKTPACHFTPLFTQRYDIELRNEGGERAVYFLVFD